METIDFEERKRFIGASDAPIVMGVSPWTTPYQLWQQKLDLVPPIEDNWAMRRGREQEPLAREAYSQKIGVTVCPKRLIHPEIHFMLANMDGISDDGAACVEIKTPCEEDHYKAKQGEIPEKYYPQLQQQLEIRYKRYGFKTMDYFSWRDGEGVLIEVKYDEKYSKKLCTENKKFWNYVENLIAPPFTERDYIQRHDEKWLQAALQWKDSKEKAQEAKKLEEEAKAILIELSKGNNSMGGGIKIEKSICKGLVDYRSIPELKHVDLEKYRKPSYDRISIRELNS